MIRVLLFITITLMAAYCAFVTPMAYKQARREIALQVSQWSELKEIQRNQAGNELDLAMLKLPIRNGK